MGDISELLFGTRWELSSALGDCCQYIRNYPKVSSNLKSSGLSAKVPDENNISLVLHFFGRGVERFANKRSLYSIAASGVTPKLPVPRGVECGGVSCC